jgi:hypothetical protein
MGGEIVAFGLTAWQLFAAAVVVASSAYSVYSAAQATESFDDAADGGLRINTRSTNEPLKVIYGQMRVGGNDFVYASSGKNGNIFWAGMSFCEGPIEGIVTDDDGDMIYLGNLRSQEYTGYLDYWFYAGTGSQTVNTQFQTVKPEFTDTQRYTAYMIWKLTWNQELYQGLPKRQVVLKGRLLYDPRDGSIAWSDNPALAAWDWITNGRYGIGENAGKLDSASFISAANYCDSKSWTINMAISKAGDRKRDMLNNILALFRGEIVWYDGRGYLRYRDLNEEASVMTINDEHIVQGADGKDKISVSQPTGFKKPDGFKIEIIDPAKEYTVDQIPVGESLGNVEELKLLGCTDRQQGADLGVYYLERQRLNRKIPLVGRDDCLKLEPSDPITLNSSALAISDQLMRVSTAVIQQSGFINLVLEYEALALYDDDYNIDEDAIYRVDLPDPTGEPPSVTNVSIEEEVYAFRLRSASRLRIIFTPPDYVWFSHVEIWQSFDNVNWVFLFDVQDDFQVDNVEEGQMYYFRLKVVSIYNKKQQDNNDYKVSKLVTGKSSALPPSLTTLSIIVGRNNAITIYSQKLTSEDIELYEFRLGSTYTGAIWLASLISPNLSFNQVKPGSHTFYCNTLGTNGLYGASPVSAAITLPDPPDDYTLSTSKTIQNLVTNGDMEVDSNWVDAGSPTLNARVSDRKHGEIYSRKFTTNAVGEGIKGDNFTTVNARKYGIGLWVNPDDNTSMRVLIRKGDNSGWGYDQVITGLTQDAWNEITIDYQEGGATGGPLAFIEFLSPPTQTNGSWYVDDVCIMEGDFTDNMKAILYDGTGYVKSKHAGSVLTGNWYSPIYDLTTSDRYLIYVISDIVIVGEGSLWNDKLPDPTKWSEVGVATKKWREIFELTASPQVPMTLKFGTTTPPTSEIDKLEIVAVTITGRYYQLQIGITDPQLNVYAQAEAPILKFCQ